MTACPRCACTERVLRTGCSNSFIVVDPWGLDWFDGREWSTVECASCGLILSENSQPLEPPDETRLRVVAS